MGKQRKPRGDSPLDRLPGELRERLDGWLLGGESYRAVVELAGMPVAEGGLGVSTSVAAVGRYYGRVIAEKKKVELAALIAQAKADTAASDGAAFVGGALTLARELVYKALAREDLETAGAAGGILRALRESEQREQELALKQERLRLEIDKVRRATETIRTALQGGVTEASLREAEGRLALL